MSITATLQVTVIQTERMWASLIWQQRQIKSVHRIKWCRCTTLAFTNGANVLADISVDTTSGVQNTGTVYVNGTRSIKIKPLLVTKWYLMKVTEILTFA